MAVKTNYEKNGYKYYRTVKTIGHKLDGTPVKKEFLGKNKSESEKKAEEYLNRIKNGLPYDFEKITIGSLMFYWLFNVVHISKKYKSSSFERYESIFRNYIEDSDISILTIYNITTVPIQEYYNELYKNGKNSSQIASLNKVLSVFFNYCIDCEYITKNPCSKRYIHIPGDADVVEDDEEEICIFTDDELNLILENLDFNETYHTIIFFAIFTGLRIGEILGLKNKYMDLKKKVTRVRYTLSSVKVFYSPKKYKSEFKLQRPKSDTSIRNVDLPQNTIEILKKYKDIQRKKYLLNNIEYNEESLLFTTRQCNMIDQRNFRRFWKRFLKDINVEYKKFHATRHTMASLLFKNGATLLEVQEILGHSDSEITRKIYIHIYPECKKEAMSKLNYLVPVKEKLQSQAQVEEVNFKVISTKDKLKELQLFLKERDYYFEEKANDIKPKWEKSGKKQKNKD